jgi:hypothetical protein
MRGKTEAAAYVEGMARVFSMKGENERQEACEIAAKTIRNATDKQTLLYSLRTMAEYQGNYGSVFAAHAFDESVQAVYQFVKE